MNKKLIAAFCVCFGVFLVGVSLLSQTNKENRETADFFYSFTDSLGNEVVLDKKPERVALLFSSLCNVWQNAGGEAAITVGESVERGFCDEDTPLVDSGAGKSINTELLISLKPDFVIYSSDVAGQKDCAALLTRAGIPSAAIRLDSFEDYLWALKLFCDLTEKQENYSLYGERVQKEVEEIKKAALKQDEKKQILFVRSGSSQSSCKAKKAEDNFAAKMLEELGCSNIADKAPLLLDGLSSEVIIKENPDFIFISLMGDEKASKAHMTSLLESPAYQSLDSEIIFLPKELFQYKPCEKWADAYSYLYKKLY